MGFYYNAYRRDFNRTIVWNSSIYDTKEEAEEEARKFEKSYPDLFTEVVEYHIKQQTKGE